MGRTLFWYVFKDLLKIFMMASGALAGIMSFGGLLRPLTQQGLDPGQVGQILAYFSPAMTAYSFPIAALFAATMVYGRLSADNELTACRAGGIPLGLAGMALPGVVFGLLVAIASLLFLCFVVPIYTLKVEQVIYSNLAKMIANQIEKSHVVRFQDFNIFATRAWLPPLDLTDQDRQKVVLEDVSFVTYEKVQFKGDNRYKYPREFLLTSLVTLDINKRDDDQVDLLVGLAEGTKFPREYRGGSQAGVGTTQFGPFQIDSPIKEDTKFMNVWQLQQLYNHPEQSRKLKTIINGFVKHDQSVIYLSQVRAALNPTDPAGKPAGLRRVVFNGSQGRIIVTVNDRNVVTTKNEQGKPELHWADEAVHEKRSGGEELGVHGTDPATIKFEREGDQPTVQTARELRIRVRPDIPKQRMFVTVELLDRSPRPGERPNSKSYSDIVSVPMTPDILQLQGRRLSHYKNSPAAVNPLELSKLNREQVVLSNAILAESNVRASFAVSCLILVIVGASLGMMFRSGNFLTAFAVSFIPALICITLIVSGQQTCHAIPFKDFDKHNPLRMGLSIIWSGNALNFLIAASLMWKLQRQ